MSTIIDEIKLDYKDVLLCQKRSALRSRAEVDLFREMKFHNSKRTYKGIPIMASNMDNFGTFEMAKALSKHGLFTVIRKYYTVDEWINFAVENPECVNNVCVVSGTEDKDLNRLRGILKAIPDIPAICCDDGGCICVGDIAKAFGAGADFVMLGSMLAGHDQSGREIIEKDGKRVCQLYGMCSATAMNKHYGGVTEYGAAEGVSVELPYKGDVENTILDILGGLRSTCAYVGASRLQDLPEQTTFVRCTPQLNPLFSAYKS